MQIFYINSPTIMFVMNIIFRLKIFYRTNLKTTIADTTLLSIK